MVKALYNKAQTKKIDQQAATFLGIDSYALMQRAALAAFQHIKQYKKLLVVTGPGNNGGDGWVVAELARKNGQEVTIWALKDPNQLSGDAQTAAQECQVEHTFYCPEQQSFDVIIDCIFGSGLNKTVQGHYAEAIDWINQQATPVYAIDIPSGLNADTGQIMGHAIIAKCTISILTDSPGLFTLCGKDLCGIIKTENLTVDPKAYQNITADAHLLHESQLSSLLTNRKHNSHKGQFGHVWVAGGQAGMMGAVQLAAFAVLKSGAGAVTAVTDALHSVTMPLQHPEIMTHAYDETHPELPIKKPDVLALGMGLGQSSWSKSLFKQLIQMPQAKVVDADALALLEPHHLTKQDVITPHPLEAARLLACSTAEIQNDRLQAAKSLNQKYHATTVLKGSGTVIADAQGCYLCPHGSDALATAGSGDVLAGMIAGLMAQGHNAAQAAKQGVLWHAITGEKSQQKLCLTASGILNELHLHLPA